MKKFCKQIKILIFSYLKNRTSNVVNNMLFIFSFTVSIGLAKVG